MCQVLDCAVDYKWSRIEFNSAFLNWQREQWNLSIIDNSKHEGLSHLILSVGETGSELQKYFTQDLPRHLNQLGVEKAKPSSAKPKVDIGSKSITEVAASLTNCRIVVYTGAGISSASGIPTFRGDNGIEAKIPLDEPFPGELVAWMIAKPNELAKLICDFQEQLSQAQPNEAHFQISILECSGHITCVVSGNIDQLHKIAGSREVITPRTFVANTSLRLSAFDTLLVLGVSDDTEGVISMARANNKRVVIVDPFIPKYLAEFDEYVCAPASNFLAALIREIDSTTQPCVIGSSRFPMIDIPSIHKSSESRLGTQLDLPRLVELVADFPSSRSTIHGVKHWQETAWIALQLLEDQPDADPYVVQLFSVFHDCQRWNDEHDPDHGRRAAQLILRMGTEHLGICDRQIELLATACALHADGYITSDPTIALCWDADRFGLWRIGVSPQPAGMSLPQSRHLCRIFDAQYLRYSTPGWDVIASSYKSLSQRLLQ
ncbi:Sir2 family NAD-dependent protein deacetylase [Phormidium tenue]|uniref:protein acetyllysine N-acetyltransferase n=1 Tax=Phormidium tenue NIES-30 TaxID=549789 RepID=A0A1U7J251_9CYAN|nr:Sir2 family NAD-dependent protein deacetylase [Phormidium tenue]MBD2233659.1 hypothetical protein [Phormidium tenue FACHB-1052]OKH46082.1 hypothetical protein NIES30_17415 [Phormidium tenue NIES-30]